MAYRGRRRAEPVRHPWLRGGVIGVSLLLVVMLGLGVAAYLKLNDSVGLTPNATDNAPEVGVMFSFGGK